MLHKPSRTEELAVFVRGSRWVEMDGAGLVKWCSPALLSPCCSQVFSELFDHSITRKWVGKPGTGRNKKQLPVEGRRKIAASIPVALHRFPCWWIILTFAPEAQTPAGLKDSDFLPGWAWQSNAWDFLSIRHLPVPQFSTVWVLIFGQWSMKEKWPSSEQMCKEPHASTELNPGLCCDTKKAKFNPLTAFPACTKHAWCLLFSLSQPHSWH